MSRPKRDLTRITINVPNQVLAVVDEYAAKHGLSRTVAIQILCISGLSASGFSLEDLSR